MGFEWDEVKNSLDKKMSETKIVQIKIFQTCVYHIYIKKEEKKEDS